MSKEERAENSAQALFFSSCGVAFFYVTVHFFYCNEIVFNNFCNSFMSRLQRQNKYLMSLL